MARGLIQVGQSWIGSRAAWTASAIGVLMREIHSPLEHRNRIRLRLATKRSLRAF